MYAELRFSPYLNGHCSGEEYCDGVFAGLERGCRDFDIKVRAILVFMREVPGEQWGLKTALEWWCMEWCPISGAPLEWCPISGAPLVVPH